MQGWFGYYFTSRSIQSYTYCIFWNINGRCSSMCYNFFFITASLIWNYFLKAMHHQCFPILRPSYALEDLQGRYNFSKLSLILALEIYGFSNILSVKKVNVFLLKPMQPTLFKLLIAQWSTALILNSVPLNISELMTVFFLRQTHKLLFF